MDTPQTLSDAQREYGLRSTTFVRAARVTVAYHCEQDDGEHTIAVTNGPNIIYLTGTFGDLWGFANTLARVVDDAHAAGSDDETDAV